MEPRQLLTTNPLIVGAVYIEQDIGSDIHGDAFELTFTGGAELTELTRLEIDTDQVLPGFSLGDAFFDTRSGGYGADHAAPFSLLQLNTQDPDASVVATVEDGGTLLVLDFSRFRAGDKVVFEIDVDEVQSFEPDGHDLDWINQGFDPITSGIEFQGSTLTANFTAPHYYPVQVEAEFRNQYDPQLEGTGLDLPADDFANRRDRTAGAVGQAQQQPLPVSLAGFVYHDRDDDGSRDPGEEGIPSSVVQIVPLETERDQSAVTATTDEHGFYQFTGLSPGTYDVVQLEQPEGYLDGQDAAGMVAGQPAGTAVNPGDRLATIELQGGQAGVEYNFGELLPVSIRGSVRRADPYGDCYSQGDTERPVPGATVSLLDQNGQELDRTQTDAQGRYVFEALPPGVYGIAEQTPAELIDGGDRVGTIDGVSAGRLAENDTIVDIQIRSGQHAVGYDFCENEPASLAGFVYHDRNNDGARQTLEEGISGVTIQLRDEAENLIATTTTDADGRYLFQRLDAGVYTLVEEQPAPWVDGQDGAGTVRDATVGHAVNPGDRIEGVELLWGDQGEGYRFGEFLYASISGSVHLTGPEGDCFTSEGDQPPVEGVSVSLLDATGRIIAEEATDAGGQYRFDALLPGVYTVVESTPPELIDGPERIGTVDGLPQGSIAADDTINGIAVLSGQTGVDYDFCEHQPASLAGSVYYDANRNGRFDAGESPIADVQLVLVGEDGSRREASTGADGRYTFSSLPAGTYAIVETQPPEYLDGSETVGSLGGEAVGGRDEIRQIPVQWGDHGQRYDFGEQLDGSISGTVHVDLDGDCVFAPGEQPLAGVTIQLLDAAGEVLLTTTTNTDGHYRFDGLAPGEYAIRELQPTGFLQGGQRAGTGGGDARQQDLIRDIPVLSGAELLNYDFCEVPPSSLSGTVYSDPNENCLFEAGEQPLAGVTVELLDEQGGVLATAQTAEDGSYHFDGLRPGTYAVREQQPQGYFDGGQRAGSGGGDARQQDLIRDIPVLAGAELVHYDFCEVPPSSLSGTIYSDPNENCLFEAGEQPLAGVAVELLDEQGRVLATAQTAEDGSYHFDGLRPGTYAVREQQPQGYFDGSQRVGSGGGRVEVANLIAEILIPAGDDLEHYDFCERPPGVLSGFVFLDGQPLQTVDGQPPRPLRIYRDGQRTPDDTPLPGVVLQLRDGRTGAPITADRALPGYYAPGPIVTTTDHNGYYEFRGLPKGEYAVYQVHPQRYADGIDTPGTTSGKAVNEDTPLTADERARLVADPANDAILQIRLSSGGYSEENNFSELDVRRLVPPPRSLPRPELPERLHPVVPAPLAPSIVQGPASTWSLEFPVYGRGGREEYSWHLSVIDAGMPRGNTDHLALSSPVWRPTSLVAFILRGSELRQAVWEMPSRTPDFDGRVRSDREIEFGKHGALPIAGDFNGDGIDEIGIYYRGRWFLDMNGNGIWDDDDLWGRLGGSLDLPVTGDWNGDGKDDIGIFGPEWEGDYRALKDDPGLPDLENAIVPVTTPKNIPPKADQTTAGMRLLQHTARGNLRADVIDHVFRYGSEIHIPVAGDWGGDGIKNIGVFFHGHWQLDVDGDGRWSNPDQTVQFGQYGDLPVVGDFNGDGIDEIGVFRDGYWIIDTNGNHELDDNDRVFQMGQKGDLPVVGDWDGDGVDDPAVYREKPEVPVVAEAPSKANSD